MLTKFFEINLPKYAIILLLSIFGCSTDTTIEVCPLWMGAVTPIDAPLTSKGKSSSVHSSASIYFNPQLLPFSIKWNKEKGFFVEHFNNIEIATPIGSFGLEYSFASKGTINGVEIKESDFIVVIVDKNKGKQDVFKIEGHNRLKIVLSGKTEIDAKPGFVQIDATYAKTSEITFKDYSKAILFNTTLKEIPFEIQVGNNYGKSTNIFKCTLPSKSYRAIPMDELNGLIEANVYIKIHNDVPNNDTYHELKKKLGHGDLCEIYNDNGGKIGIKKINLTNNNGWQWKSAPAGDIPTQIAEKKTLEEQPVTIENGGDLRGSKPLPTKRPKPNTYQQPDDAPSPKVEDAPVGISEDPRRPSPPKPVIEKPRLPEAIYSCRLQMKKKKDNDKEKPIKGNVITFNFEVEPDDIKSNHPSSSYELKRVKSCTKLFIKNPTVFWSVSKKLIVSSKKDYYDFADRDVQL